MSLRSATSPYYPSPWPCRPPFAKAILESGATTARAVFYPTRTRANFVQFCEFLVAASTAVPRGHLFDAPQAAGSDHPRGVQGRLGPVRAHRHLAVPARHRWAQPLLRVEPRIVVVVIVVPSSSNFSASSNTTAPPVIPDPVRRLVAARRHFRIPVMTGFNTDEGAMFVPQRADTSADFAPSSRR